MRRTRVSGDEEGEKKEDRRTAGGGRRRCVCRVPPWVAVPPFPTPCPSLSLSHTKTLFFPPFSLSSPPARLEELRALNRKTFEETGAYMTEEEIKAFRQPRWTDRREFVDDD